MNFKNKYLIIVLILTSILLLNSFFLFLSVKNSNKYYRNLVIRLQYDIELYSLSLSAFLENNDSSNSPTLMIDYGRALSSYILWMNYVDRFNLDNNIHSKITSIYNYLTESIKTINEIAPRKNQDNLSAADVERISDELNIIKEISKLLKYENIKNKRQIIKAFSNMSI